MGIFNSCFHNKKDDNDAAIRLIFLGPPGCGKGTQAEKVCEEYLIRHLATGDMLRLAVNEGSDVGVLAKTYMDAGQLVPDDLVIKLIKDSIHQNGNMRSTGFVLDGFPRTVIQAEKLDEMLSEDHLRLSKVIHFQIPDEMLIQRIVGRLVHPQSGRSYHREFNPPKQEMIDDITGDPLIQRSDDNEETLIKRLTAYHIQTEPVISYYKSTGILSPLDATHSPNQVLTELKRIIAEQNI